MEDLRFTWDIPKDSANFAKHAVTFTEAKTAFLDPAAVVIADPDHSATEERFVLLGVSARLRLLVVAH